MTKLHQVAGNFQKFNYLIVGNIYESIGLLSEGMKEKAINVVPVDAVQETTLRVPVGENQVLECICKISLEKLEGVYILRKIVEFNPKYVILNSLEQSIKVKIVSEDKNIKEQQQIFKKGERQPLLLMKESGNFKVQVSLNNDAYTWSGKIAIDSVGLYCLKLIKKRKEMKTISKFIFMKLNVSMQENIVFVEINQGNDMYVIENRVENLKIKAYQKGFEKTGIKIVNEMQYGWDEPLKEKLVMLKLQHEDDNFKIEKATIEFDRLDVKEIVKMKSQDGKQVIEIKITTKAINKQKRIILEQIQSKSKMKFTALFGNLDKEGKKYLNELTQSIAKVDKLTVFKQLSFHLNKFSLTIIQNHIPGEAKELINFYFENIECALVETKLSRIIQMRIQFINLDNLSSYNLLYQCPITPSKKQELCGNQPKKVFLDLLLEQNLSAECIVLLKQVKFDIQPLSIKIEWEFLNTIIDLTKNLKSFMQKDEQKQINDNFLKISQAEKYEFSWLNAEIKDQSKAIYIQEITLSPIEFYISFTMASSASGENQEAIEFTGMITRALGFALANLDDANIKVPGIHLNQCFDTLQGIQTKILKHYKVFLLASLFKVFGSIDIIGNPVGLFTNIGTGVKDLFEKPIEGIVQGGPLEGGIALAKGAGSLITHTISGTFNSLNKITSSLAGGLSALTFDSAYLQQRQQLKNQKADSIVTGLNQAGISVFKGFEQGLTGIFLDPIRMAKQQGTKGFFKGVFTGVTGVVLKPVAGILDAAAKTAEGVKGSANKFNDHANESWIRRPREFYGEEKFYKCFIAENAELFNLMQVYKKGKYKNIALYEIIWMNEKVMIVSEEWMILLSKQKKKREWEIQSSNIQKAQLQKNGIEIILKNAVKKIPKGIVIINESQSDKQRILLEKIEELIDTVKLI